MGRKTSYGGNAAGEERLGDKTRAAWDPNTPGATAPVACPVSAACDFCWGQFVPVSPSLSGQVNNIVVPTLCPFAQPIRITVPLYVGHVGGGDAAVNDTDTPRPPSHTLLLAAASPPRCRLRGSCPKPGSPANVQRPKVTQAVSEPTSSHSKVLYKQTTTIHL